MTMRFPSEVHHQQNRPTARLNFRKIYEVLADPKAESHTMIRVIDEENQDYLYPASWFLPIELPTKVEQAISELVEH